MTVTISNNGRFVRLSGTIQEVLEQATTSEVGADRIVYYSDDNTDAVAVYSMIK